MWGARKLKRWLEMQWHTLPVASTVHNLMRRHDLLPGGPSPAAPTVGRFEHDAPNRLWQMDFKGHFPFAGGRCHPLTLLDDHSRFSLCLAHCPDERRVTVQSQLIAVFDAWRDSYNLERPHEALSMAVPASRYQPSSRQYNGNPVAAEYDEGVLVRKVDISGKLSLKGVGLKVGMIDLRNRSIIMGKGC